MKRADPAEVVVIGIGNPYRHDDGVGSAAARLVRLAVPGAEVVELDGEPTRIMEAWADRDLAVVIDAVRAGGQAGTIHRIDVAVDPLPDCPARGSTHHAGLAEAVALARALGRLPARLVVYGIEPGDLTDGEGLSAPVRQALPAVAQRVMSEIELRCV